MIYIKILAGIALIGSIVWVIAEPGFDSALAIVGSLSALISAITVENKKAQNLRQRQSISKSSTGIQAGGNINIGNIEDGNKHAKRER